MSRFFLSGEVSWHCHGLAATLHICWELTKGETTVSDTFEAQFFSRLYIYKTSFYSQLWDREKN